MPGGMIGPVYVITDPGAPLSVPDQARAAARGGARAVQLRDKTASDADLLALARQLLPEMRAHGVKLFLNDRIEVALAAGADGLHVGQGDGKTKVGDVIGHEDQQGQGQHDAKYAEHGGLLRWWVNAPFAPGG